MDDVHTSAVGAEGLEAFAWDRRDPHLNIRPGFQAKLCSLGGAYFALPVLVEVLD